MAFTGIPEDALVFYEQLEANNTKAFWEDNKARFKEVVRGPAEALADELSSYGEFHLFRPHNDLRFSKNKPPYKTHQGAYTESERGAGYYFHISAQGLMCGTGYYAMAKDQLERFRAAVDAEHTGAEIEAITSALAPQIPSAGPLPNGSMRQGPMVQLRQHNPSSPNPH